MFIFINIIKVKKRQYDTVAVSLVHAFSNVTFSYFITKFNTVQYTD